MTRIDQAPVPSPGAVVAGASASVAPSSLLRVARARRVPVWLVLLAAYGVSRVVTSAGIALVYWLATTAGWRFASFEGTPTLVGFLQSWDGLYYRDIAIGGYPTELPLDATGEVAKNPWAFLPVFPMMVRAVASVTGMDFALAGAVVAAVFGLGATLVLYRMLVPQVGETSALWGALLFCFSPLSFVLQTAYAESVFLFFMFCGLGAMAARRYLVMIPVGIAAAFSHPGALALAAALGLHVIVRFVRRQSFSRRELTSAVVAGLVIAAAGFAWPPIAAGVTGRADAYFETELAWWQDYIGRVQFTPFSPWFLMAGHYLGWAGIVMVVAVIAASAWLLLRRSSRLMGTDVQLYSASYVAYLVAVFLPQQSIFRMLMPLSPVLGHPGLSRTPRRRHLLLAGCVAAQPVVILLLWFIFPP